MAGLRKGVNAANAKKNKEKPKEKTSVRDEHLR